MKKLIAGVIALVLLVSAFAVSGGLSNGRRTDGLYYKASNIHPDAKLLTINGDAVTAEEYLYWLAYDCDYLTSASGGELDWSSDISDGMTYADYTKADVLETVKLYTIIRQWAEQGNITLTAEDQEQLEQQRQEYVSYYGSEEAYAQQIRLLGISDEAFDNINEAYYLYAHVKEAFADSKSSLYPGKQALEDFVQQQNMVTAKLLYISTVGVENKDALRAKYETAENYAAQLQEADDVNAVYAQLAEELGLEYPENGMVLSAETTQSNPELLEAVQTLEEGQISDVIECENGYYVAVRTAMNQASVAELYFEQQLESAKKDAQVKFNEKLYDSINTASFYAALLEQRSALQEEYDSAEMNEEGDTASNSANTKAGIVLPAN